MDTLVSLDHLPRRDEKQWATLIGEFPGGMAANVAVSFARLGGSVRLIAQVGRDFKGAAASASLRATSVDVTEVREVDDPTFWTLSLIDRQGERSMVEFASMAIHPPWHLIRENAINGVKAVYTIGSDTAGAIGLFRASYAQRTTTAVDVDFAEIDSHESFAELLKFTTILFCNSDTACQLVAEATPERAARGLSNLGLPTVVVTLGPHGALAVDKREGEARVTGHDVAAVDTTGAGDCFAGAFLFGHVRGWPLPATLELANLMAAVSTTAYGCQTGILKLKELARLAIARDMAFQGLVEGII